MTLLFRLLSFFLRVAGSFFFVFFLQIQFAGKTLESYLNDFGKKFIVTRSLQKVSQDGVKVIKSVTSSEDEKSELRKISSSKAAQYVKDLAQQIKLPEEILKKEEKEKDSSE